MKTIIDMAREAGIRDVICDGTRGCLERLVELARADERERSWVGLTDEDITEIDQGLYPTWKDELQAIEARLKEKNT